MPNNIGIKLRIDASYDGLNEVWHDGISRCARGSNLILSRYVVKIEILSKYNAKNPNYIQI